jgi:hypothetical protein
MPNQLLRENSVVLMAKGPTELECIFIGSGMSLNRHLYSEAMLRASADKFKGAPIYIDHPTMTEMFDQPERSMRSLAGVILRPEYNTWTMPDGSTVPGVGGTARISSQASWLVDLFQEGIGGDMSLVAYVDGNDRTPSDEELTRYGEGDYFDITEIHRVASVDFVTTAAAKGSILKILKENYDGAMPRAFYVPSAKTPLVTDLVYTDALLGQALRVDRNSHALVLLESAGFRTDHNTQSIYDPTPDTPPAAAAQPVETPPATPSAATSSTEPAADLTVETELLEFDDSIEPAWVAPIKEQVREGFTSLVETLRSLNTAVNNLTAQVNNTAPAESTEQANALDDLEANTSENTVPEADMQQAIEGLLSSSDLALATIQKLREAVHVRGYVGRAKTMAQRGVPRPDVLETLRANVQAEIDREVAYINKIAPAVVTGAGGDYKTESAKTPATADVNGVLAKYGMIDTRRGNNN